MSASLIGRLGSSTFRLSTTAVSMSLTGSRFSSESAPRPLYGAFFVKEIWQGALFFFASFFVRSEGRFFVPIRTSLESARAGAVKVGRRANLAACSTLPRPHLDSFEHDGTAWCGSDDDDQRGSPLAGADQSRHNLVFGGSKDPNHDAVMRIGSEAPKRRTHSSIRHKSQGTSRDSATSNRYRRPVTSGQGRNCRGAFNVLRSLCRTQNDAVRDNALPHEPPQGDQ